MRKLKFSATINDLIMISVITCITVIFAKNFALKHPYRVPAVCFAIFGLRRWFELNKEVTKRIKVEEELKKYEENLEDTLKMRAQELYTNERRLNYSLMAGEIGIWELDVNTKKVWRSLHHDKIFGYNSPLPDWTYDTFLGHVLPEDRPAMHKAFEEAIVAGLKFHHTCRILRKDGEIRWIDIQSRPAEYDGHREPLLIIGLSRDITEHKDAESSKVRAELLESLIESMPDMVVTNDIEGRITGFNSVAKDTFGFREEDLDKLPTEFVVNEDRYKVEQAIKECREKGYFRNLEVTILIKDKKELPVNINVALIKDGRGGVIGQIAVLRDISERKRMEEILKNSEALYHRLFEASKDGLFIIDAISGKILDANPSIAEILGYAKDELLGKELWQIISFKELADSMEKYLNLQNEDSGYYENLPLSKKNGDKIETEIIRSLYTMDHRRVMQLSVRDITRRRMIEAALTISEMNYRAIFDSASDAIMIRDMETYKTIDANKAACEMFGYSKEEMTGLYIKDFMTEEAKYAWKDAKHFYEKAVAGEPQLFEWLARDKDGRPFWVEANIKRAMIGGRYCIISMLRDINERKRLFEMKENFMNTISHELRTPLSAIKEGITIVLDEIQEKAGEENKKCLMIAKDNVDRLNRIIDGVLDFQKLDAGKMKFDMVENDLNGVVRECCDAMAPLMRQKKIKFSMNLSGALPHIVFDKDKILQVLMNLVNNAIKFTSRGNIDIATRLDEEFVVIAIRDTGIGIKKEDVEKLFQKFEQVAETDAMRVGGTGLGLVISKGIIEEHKDRIWIESEPGKGSTAYFTLPVK